MGGASGLGCERGGEAKQSAVAAAAIAGARHGAHELRAGAPVRTPGRAEPQQLPPAWILPNSRRPQALSNLIQALFAVTAYTKRSLCLEFGVPQTAGARQDRYAENQLARAASRLEEAQRGPRRGLLHTRDRQ